MCICPTANVRKNNAGGKAPRAMLKPTAPAAAKGAAASRAAAAATKPLATDPLPSYKPVDYSRFDAIPEDDSEEEPGPVCYCGKRHGLEDLHGNKVNFEDDDIDEDEDSQDSDEDYGGMSRLENDEEIAIRAAFHARHLASMHAMSEQLAKTPTVPDGNATATAPAKKAAKKPKGIAKGFLAGSASAKATTSARLLIFPISHRNDIADGFLLLSCLNCMPVMHWYLAALQWHWKCCPSGMS